MRTDKVLLGLLFIYIVNDRNFLGMCCCLAEMVNIYAYPSELKGTKISIEEKSRIRAYLCDNQPNGTFTGYWWNKREKQPRLKWLNKEIAKLKRHEKNGRIN